ncbi:MAG: hypothetical protein IKK41_03575 [Oscillospiraceae bacterium]|nr:hypothetical protein [Oscillospiraceae bacterium]
MKNKILSIVLSAVVAFGLWLYVVTVVSPGSESTYYNVPVVLQNENVLQERGLMITSDLPTVNLDLSGNRTDLNKLDSNNINILVNVATIESAGTHQMTYTVSYPGTVNGNDITRTGQSTNIIPLTVEKRITKNVDVVAEYIGSVPEGFIADKENAVLDYQTVEVSGPESVIEKIAQARIQVDLTDKNVTVAGQYIYDLCDAQGNPVDVQRVTTNVEAVNLTVKVKRVKELTLAVETAYGGGATENNSTVTISHKSIYVSGSDALLEDLDVLELGTVNLGEILEDTTLTFPITLPEGVTNESGITEVTVEVKFADLKVKTLNISNIQALHIPEGMEVDMITQTLEITVRGPSLLIDAITEDDITVTVDFTNAQTGTATMRAQVEFGSNFSDAGTVGSYVVSATLKDREA